MKAFIKKFFAQTNFWVTLSAVVMFLFLVSGNLAINSLETPVQAADMADTDEDEDLNLDVLDSEIGESDSKADQNDAPEEETIPEDEPQAETPAEPEAQSILEDTANTDVPEKSVEEVKQKSGKELKKEPVEKNDKKSKIDIPPLETVLPANSAVILRASSVRDFNERLEKLTETNFLMLFKTLGKGSYAKQVVAVGARGENGQIHLRPEIGGAGFVREVARVAKPARVAGVGDAHDGRAFDIGGDEGGIAAFALGAEVQHGHGPLAANRPREPNLGIGRQRFHDSPRHYLKSGRPSKGRSSWRAPGCQIIPKAVSATSSAVIEARQAWSPRGQRCFRHGWQGRSRMMTRCPSP